MTIDLIDRLCIEVERRTVVVAASDELRRKLIFASEEASKWKRDAEIYQARGRVLAADNERLSKKANEAEPHITALYKAAENLQRALPARRQSRLVMASTALTKALKAAEPHVDLIPF